MRSDAACLLGRGNLRAAKMQQLRTSIIMVPEFVPRPMESLDDHSLRLSGSGTQPGGVTTPLVRDATAPELHALYVHQSLCPNDRVLTRGACIRLSCRYGYSCQPGRCGVRHHSSGRPQSAIDLCDLCCDLGLTGTAQHFFPLPAGRKQPGLLPARLRRCRQAHFKGGCMPDASSSHADLQSKQSFHLTSQGRVYISVVGFSRSAVQALTRL
jgi:hypothetical protein